MSATISHTVVGDGTTAPQRVARRWRRVRWATFLLAMVALVVGALAATRVGHTTTPFAPDSVADYGARALAQVLRRQGVHIRHVTTVDDAVRAATPGSTLFIAPRRGPGFSDEQVRALAEVPANLVILEPAGTLLRLATNGQIGLQTIPGQELREPNCPLPAAIAAGPSELRGTITRGTPPSDAAIGCWPIGHGYALVQVTTPAPGDPTATRTVTAVDDPALIINSRITEHGNAALALHLLGATEQLVWFVPARGDWSTGVGAPSLGSILPHWFGAAALWATLCLLTMVFWRARRLGPLVTEPLPVLVPAAEATRGRGRLYRRARAHGHAAASLRAASAERLASRLGVPHSAAPVTLVAAISRATGHEDTHISTLLYGIPPATDAGLAALARRLDELESKVHQ
ncbi:MAG: DUF4350 domain-containing protein [Promicromonosporaceae bacterium]|nr:DUF4350 domain-containing protein [Promicromonosporaceae bacterium]